VHQGSGTAIWSQEPLTTKESRLRRRNGETASRRVYEDVELISYGIKTGGNFAYRLTRYFGVLAPAATFRPWIVPDGVTTIAPPAFMPPHPGCPGEAGTPVTGAAQTNTKQSKKRKNYSWAQLMMRVFELDVLFCPRCGGRMRVMCPINPPLAIEKILACLGLPTRAPPIAPAKSDRVNELF
jgi:hypothetical protein